MLFRFATVLDRKFWAAVQASEAHDAFLLDPDRLFAPQLDGLHRAFLRAQPTADAAVFHMEMGGAPHLVVVDRRGDPFCDEGRCARNHMAAAMPRANALYQTADLRFCMLRV